MDLPLGSYDDPPGSPARLVNCYRENGGEQGLPPLLGFPGISDYRTVGSRVRAAIAVHGVKYVVSGNKFYREGAEVGTVSGSARPQLASNGVQVAILIQPNLWVYTIATEAFAKVTDTDFPGASSIQFFDNYITYTEVGNGRWGASDLADADSFDALMFATAEGAPDNLVTHVVDHRQAFLLGVESCELWDNAGVSGFPFVRNPNGFVEIGCLVGASAQKADQSIFWLASDYTVRKLSGATAQRVSTHQIERKFKTYTLAGTFAQVLNWEGHIFYVLTFPEATWALDLNTQKWFELQSFGLPNWRVSCSVLVNGRTYVGDSSSGKFGLLDDVFTEWDDQIVMSWTYAPTREAHSCVEIIAEMGVGLSTGQGSDPEIMLALSRDGGKTYHDLPTRKLGQIGEYENRVRWHRLSLTRKNQMRVYRGSISDPVRRKILATSLT